LTAETRWISKNETTDFVDWLVPALCAVLAHRNPGYGNFPPGLAPFIATEAHRHHVRSHICLDARGSASSCQTSGRRKIVVAHAKVGLARNPKAERSPKSETRKQASAFSTRCWMRTVFVVK
jgi:hypothetical protein